MTRLYHEKRNREDKARKLGTIPAEEPRPPKDRATIAGHGHPTKLTRKQSSKSSRAKKAAPPDPKGARTAYLNAIIRGSKSPRMSGLDKKTKMEIAKFPNPKEWARSQPEFPKISGGPAREIFNRDLIQSRKDAQQAHQPEKEADSAFDFGPLLAVAESIQAQINALDDEIKKLINAIQGAKTRH